MNRALGIDTLAYNVTYTLTHIETLNQELTKELIQTIEPLAKLTLHKKEEKIIKDALKNLRLLITLENKGETNPEIMSNYYQTARNKTLRSFTSLLTN